MHAIPAMKTALSPVVAPASAIVLSLGTLFITSCGLVAPLHEKTMSAVLPHQAGQAIDLETANGKIKVTRVSRSDVAIVTTLRCTSPERLEQTAVTPSRSADGVLQVGINWPDGKRKSREGYDITVEVPDAHDIKLRSSNGSITLKQLGGVAKIRTSNGSITVEDHAGPVEARTSNGKVRVERVQGDADLDSSNGSIKAYAIAGAVDAETSNGTVELVLGADSRGPINAKSSNGSIKVGVGSLEGTLELKTSNGSLKIEDGLPGRVLEKSKKRAVLQFGRSGAPKSTLRTSNGSITVRSS